VSRPRNSRRRCRRHSGGTRSGLPPEEASPANPSKTSRWYESRRHSSLPDRDRCSDGASTVCCCVLQVLDLRGPLPVIGNVVQVNGALHLLAAIDQHLLLVAFALKASRGICRYSISAIAEPSGTPAAAQIRVSSFLGRRLISCIHCASSSSPASGWL